MLVFVVMFHFSFVCAFVFPNTRLLISKHFFFVFFIVKTVQNRLDSSGMAFGFCSLCRFCGLCGCIVTLV